MVGVHQLEVKVGINWKCGCSPISVISRLMKVNADVGQNDQRRDPPSLDAAHARDQQAPAGPAGTAVATVRRRRAMAA